MSNSECVDLTNLRMVTDGDRELEQELFEEYINSSTALIEELQQHCEHQNDNETWRRASHSLKGISLNLGANDLGELGKQGQDSSDLNMDAKTKILESMKEEHQKVVSFLKTQL